MAKSKDKKRAGDLPARPIPQNNSYPGVPGLQQQAHLKVDQKTTTYIFHSPVPPPEELAKFNQVIPNGAERLLGMVEKEQVHRHAMDFADVADAKRGMNYAFVISMTVIVGGFAAIAMGNPVTGSLFAGGGLISVIALFIQGRSYQQKKRQNGEAKEAKPATQE